MIYFIQILLLRVWVDVAEDDEVLHKAHEIKFIRLGLFGEWFDEKVIKYWFGCLIADKEEY